MLLTSLLHKCLLVNFAYLQAWSSRDSSLGLETESFVLDD